MIYSIIYTFSCIKNKMRRSLTCLTPAVSSCWGKECLRRPGGGFSTTSQLLPPFSTNSSSSSPTDSRRLLPPEPWQRTTSFLYIQVATFILFYVYFKNHFKTNNACIHLKVIAHCARLGIIWALMQRQAKQIKARKITVLHTVPTWKWSPESSCITCHVLSLSIIYL